jgi:putative intracellular protease/amidase
MFDIVTDAVSQALIAEFWEAEEVVATICHGSAALLHVKLSNGKYLVTDKKVTGFSDAEEQDIKAMPFSLEEMLKERSVGQYEKASTLFAPHVVVAGNLVTGQNPASASQFGKAILAAIS